MMRMAAECTDMDMMMGYDGMDSSLDILGGMESLQDTPPPGGMVQPNYRSHSEIATDDDLGSVKSESQDASDVVTDWYLSGGMQRKGEDSAMQMLDDMEPAAKRSASTMSLNPSSPQVTERANSRGGNSSKPQMPAHNGLLNKGELSASTPPLSDDGMDIMHKRKISDVENGTILPRQGSESDAFYNMPEPAPDDPMRMYTKTIMGLGRENFFLKQQFGIANNQVIQLSRELATVTEELHRLRVIVAKYEGRSPPSTSLEQNKLSGGQTSAPEMQNRPSVRDSPVTMPGLNPPTKPNIPNHKLSSEALSVHEAAMRKRLQTAAENQDSGNEMDGGKAMEESDQVRNSKSQKPSISVEVLDNQNPQSRASGVEQNRNNASEMAKAVSMGMLKQEPSNGDSSPSSKDCKGSDLTKSLGKDSKKDGQPRFWTADEHRRFLEAVRMYGYGNARQIAAYVQTRNITQVRTHAQKYILKLSRMGSSALKPQNDLKPRNMERRGYQTPTNLTQEEEDQSLAFLGEKDEDMGFS
mmetsp:Transcript_38902/g.122564  ORF Transcript_38902/g.122564 Transcript_38902/m.122564 type:complete len:526 (-) Transcript_38902:1434-3011(-)